MEKAPALPKNIRQIGEISGREKVCIEDYVMTWIRKREQQEEKGCLGIFFGERQETEDSVYIYIRGVFEVPEKIQEQQDREALREEYEKYFEGWTVQGCCVIGIYPTDRMRALAEWIPETGKLIYHLQEQEETLYWTGEEQYRRLRGYFVFYEQNRNMQEYLSQLFKDNSVEKESAPDNAIRSFRAKVREKGEIRQSNFLRMASSFFVITILIIGAIVVNRVEDIRLARSLSVADEVSVYQSKEDGENLQSASSGSATWQVAQKVTAGQTEAPEGTAAKYGAEAGTAQYDAIQKAAEEAELAGSNAFWEETDLEDETDTQSAEETEAEDVASEDAAAESAAAGGAVPEDAAAESAASGGAVPEDAAAESVAAGITVPEDTAAENVAEESSVPNDAVTEDAAAESPAKEAAAVRSTQSGYVIKEGDTLAAICSRYYGTMDRIAEVCEVNGIEDANRIMPGQRIVLP